MLYKRSLVLAGLARDRHRMNLSTSTDLIEFSDL